VVSEPGSVNQVRSVMAKKKKKKDVEKKEKNIVSLDVCFKES
jgi:hypothetical protein